MLLKGEVLRTPFHSRVFDMFRRRTDTILINAQPATPTFDAFKTENISTYSLRKYFKTELVSLHAQPDYIDYMMGHKVDSYHDIQMKGVEFLRGIYSASGLGIHAKTQLSKIEMAKQVLAAVAGVRPEEILIREAQAYPHRSYASTDTQAQVLMNAIREAVKSDLVRSV